MEIKKSDTRSVKDVLGLDGYKWTDGLCTESPYRITAVQPPKCERFAPPGDEKSFRTVACAESKGIAPREPVFDMDTRSLKIGKSTVVAADGVHSGGKTYRVHTLDVRTRRYTCANAICSGRDAGCKGRSFVESTAEIPAGIKRTARLNETIKSLAVLKSFLTVAKATETDENTVRRLFDARVREEDAKRSWLMPDVLGVHRMTLADTEFYVFIDVPGKRLLEMAALTDNKRIKNFAAGLLRSGTPPPKYIITGLDDHVVKKLLPMMFPGADYSPKSHALLIERWYVLKTARDGVVEEIELLDKKHLGHSRINRQMAKMYAGMDLDHINLDIIMQNERQLEYLQRHGSVYSALEQLDEFFRFYIEVDVDPIHESKRIAEGVRMKWRKCTPEKWLEDRFTGSSDGGKAAREKIMKRETAVVAYLNYCQGIKHFCFPALMDEIEAEIILHAGHSPDANVWRGKILYGLWLAVDADTYFKKWISPWPKTMYCNLTSPGSKPSATRYENFGIPLDALLEMLKYHLNNNQILGWI